MKKIRQYLVKYERLEKVRSFKPYELELTVFINVKIDNLNEYSKLNSLTVNNVVKIKSDKINTKTDKKYLLISLKSKLTSEKNNLFLYIFFGLLNDKI